MVGRAVETVALPEAVVVLPLGLVAGVVATVGMDVVMRFLPEGSTPPGVAAGVLTRTPPDESNERIAGFVHYSAGAGTGVLLAWLLLVARAVTGSRTVAAVGAGAALYALMVGFFATVPLPVSDCEDDRKPAVLRDWSVCAAVYTLVAVPVLVLLTVFV